MLHNPPGEKEWVSWSVASVWSVIIFATIPFARALQKLVQDLWGRDVFVYIVIVATLLMVMAAVAYLVRHRIASPANYVWLITVGGVFIWYTVELRKAPEEALHFVEYGVLGVLLYRALSQRVRDISIYFSAAVIGAIIGALDEIIQWITPERFWGYRDIWLNFFAVSLVQIGIAKGLRPSLICGLPKPASVRLFTLASIAALLVLGFSLLNTPSRVSGYAEHIPGLAFLKDNPSAMGEFGHLYQDPDIGTFRSRLSPQRLKHEDSARAEQAARILDAYKDGHQYQQFLAIYTPSRDPFLHEARVHLFRRDRYLRKSENHRYDEDQHTLHMTVAYRENKILEKYFGQTLKRSSYRLPESIIEVMALYQEPKYDYESPVSKQLITRVNEWQMLALLGAGILALIVLNILMGHRMRGS